MTGCKKCEYGKYSCPLDSEYLEFERWFFDYKFKYRTLKEVAYAAYKAGKERTK